MVGDSVTRDELIAALREAREGSHELDVSVHEYFHGCSHNKTKAIGADENGLILQCQKCGAENVRPVGVLMRTFSIDAALTLLPSEFGWALSDIKCDAKPEATIFTLGTDYDHIVAEAATPALAICLARLEYDEMKGTE